MEGIRSRVVAAFAGAVVLVAQAADGGNDAAVADAIRGDVAAFVRRIEGRPDPHAPSPTALANRLGVAGESKVRPVLEEAWTATARAPRSREAVRRLVLFLYGLGSDPNAATGSHAEPVDVDGIVRVRGEGDAADVSTGPAEEPTEFATLVAGGRFRKPLTPDFARLSASLDKGRVAALPPAEKDDFARALGESCAGDESVCAELTRRAAAAPTDDVLPTAVAWSGGRDAAQFLAERVASLAAAVADAGPADAAALERNASALAHARRESLREVMDGLPAPARDAVLRTVGLDLSLAYLLQRHAVAGADQSFRDVAVARMAGLIVSRPARLGEVPAAVRDAATRLFARALERADGLRRKSILYAAERLHFDDGSTPPTRGGPAGDGGVAVGPAPALDPYPSMASVLAPLATELVEGGLVLVDDDLFADSGGEFPAGDVEPARSDVRSPDPTVGEAPPATRSPLRLRGEMGTDGLHLKLTNDGASEVAIAASALPLVVGDVVANDFQMKDGPRTKYRELRLRLGVLRQRFVVPADALLVLRPGASHAWTVDVRDEDRDVDHVAVEFLPRMTVRGKPSATLVAGFATTWVK